MARDESRTPIFISYLRDADERACRERLFRGSQIRRRVTLETLLIVFGSDRTNHQDEAPYPDFSIPGQLFLHLRGSPAIEPITVISSLL